jgi:hypothetical protein
MLGVLPGQPENAGIFRSVCIARTACTVRPIFFAIASSWSVPSSFSSFWVHLPRPFHRFGGFSPRRFARREHASRSASVHSFAFSDPALTILVSWWAF